MKENNQIGEIFKDAFEGFEKQPSSDVWQGIETKMGNVNPPGNWLSQIPVGTKIIAVLSAVIITTAVILSVSTKNNRTEENIIPVAHNIQKETEISTPVEQPVTHEDVEKTDQPQEVVSTINQTEPIVKSDKNNFNNTKPVSTDQTNSKESSNLDNDNPVIPEVSEVVVDELPDDKEGKVSKSKNETPKDLTSSNPETIVFPENQTICLGEEVELIIEGGQKYIWSTGELTSSIKVKPEYSDIYSVTVTRSNNTTVSKEIKVDVGDCSVMYFPNAFTPNGDNYNDFYKPEGGVGIQSFNMRILNRRGELMFETNDLNVGWDGTIKGSAAPVDTYVCFGNYVDGLNRMKTFRHTVLLKR